MLRAHKICALWATLCIGIQPAFPGETCRGTLYLTIDTGSMSQAERIAGILRSHHIKATFFLANEPTIRGDYTLDDSWAGYWQSLVKDGNAFGSHTWRHGYLRADLPSGEIRYVVQGVASKLNQQSFCEELHRVDVRFEQLTGRKLDHYWRAPGGYTTPNAIGFARECGYEHVGWSPAGFLGDELPSDRFPNALLAKRAVDHLRDGDILMMHLGIRSRKDPFAPELDPILTALQAKGFCFATIPERKAHVRVVR